MELKFHTLIQLMGGGAAVFTIPSMDAKKRTHGLFYFYFFLLEIKTEYSKF